MIKLGRVVLSSWVSDLIESTEDDIIKPILENHRRGFWGDVSDSENASNDRAVYKGGRVVSRYELGHETFLVLTEADRSYTTILIENEF